MNRSKRYAGKLFSVMGDSISTFEGYNLPYNPVYYQHEMRYKTGVIRLEDTWWFKVIDHFGGVLYVNHSISGSFVAKLPHSDNPFPSACIYRRVLELSRGGIDPDVILVYMGTNDWGYGTFAEKTEKTEGFAFAYGDMVQKMRERYPNAEIWCCSLNACRVSSRPDFVFEPVCGDEHIEVYNRAISDVCKEYGVRYLDMYSHGVPYDTCDEVHPNAAGMETLARLCILEAEKE